MRFVANKGSKFAVLRKHDGMTRHLPEMCRLNEENLTSMLQKYRYVVVKPYVGTGGAGVIKVEKLNASLYRIHHGAKIRTFRSFGRLKSAIDRIRRGRACMIQRGIRLATYRGRRVDYRVKMVKAGGKWKITAVVARVARPGLFVTNLCRGGTMLGAMRTLSAAFPVKQARLKKETMRGVARTGVALLEAKYPGIGALGFDFGVDRAGNVWVLEVNTNPH